MIAIVSDFVKVEYEKLMVRKVREDGLLNRCCHSPGFVGSVGNKSFAG